MPVQNCAACGKIFNRTLRDVCPACWEAEQLSVDAVAALLHQDPDLAPGEVMRRLDIPEDRLVKLLKRGRLLGYPQLAAILKCERCGAPADRGPFCASCKAIASALVDTPAVAVPPEPEPKPRSHPPQGPRPAATPPPESPPRIRTDLHDHWRRRARP